MYIELQRDRYSDVEIIKEEEFNIVSQNPDEGYIEVYVPKLESTMNFSHGQLTNTRVFRRGVIYVEKHRGVWETHEIWDLREDSSLYQKRLSEVEVFESEEHFWDVVESRDLDCLDNRRSAWVDGGIKEIEDYFIAESNGCCGWSDEYININGRLMMIGFNYGH